LKEPSRETDQKIAEFQNRVAPKPVKAGKALPRGEAPGPDERRPNVKADEIYGDTKIPARSRKA
jgi:hypothetical protein